jgi:hypothetical protein
MGSYLFSYEQFFGDLMVLSMAACFTVLGLLCLDLGHYAWRRCKGDLEGEPNEETNE